MQSEQAIARALYARSPICILDDAFKGLDNTTSEAVMNNLLGPHGLLRGGNFTSIISSSERQIFFPFHKCKWHGSVTGAN